jgi:hypothetical protein
MSDVTDPEVRIKAERDRGCGIKGVTMNSFVCSRGYAKKNVTLSLNV